MAPRGAKPCRRLVGGDCQYGEGCEYAHLASHRGRENVNDDITTTTGEGSPANNNTTTTNNNNNDDGNDERNLPPPPPPPPAADTPTPTTVEKVLGGSLSVTFGPGLLVHSVSTITITSSTISIDSLPRDTTAPDILLLAHEFLPHLPLSAITISHKSYNTARALIHFGDNAAADMAVKTLNGRAYRGDRTLLVKSIRAKNASPYATKIDCAWFPSTTSALLGMASREALERVRGLCERGVFIRGRRVQTLVQRGRETAWLPYWVFLGNLDPWTTEAEIRGGLEEEGEEGKVIQAIELGKPNYALSDSETLAFLRQKFQVKRDELKVTSGPNDAKQRASITYANAEDAAGVYGLLRKEEDEMFGKMGLEFTLSYSASFQIPAEIYRAVKGEIGALAEREAEGGGKGKGKGREGGQEAGSEAAVRIKIIDGRGPGAVVMVNGQDRQAVAAVKASIQKLLVGKVVLTDEGKPLWDPVLRGVEGQELIRQVCEAGSVHVHCDARNQQIRLYGSLEDCEITEQTLKEDYSLLLSKEHEIVLDERMKRMGTRGGFLAVKLVAGEENVFLDPSGEKLIVRCSPLDIAKVKSLLMQPPSMKQLLKGMKAATAEEQLPAMEEGTCPVCTEPAETPFVRTACGHVYCEGCFSGYVKSALDSRKFPIQCFHNSRENTQCNTPFPIALLQRALSHADADQLFEASFAGHVQSLPGTYSYCPTPDCPTVYTVTPLDDDQHITTCSQCLVGICTTCKAPAHYGQSCHQHQQPTDLEERFTEWKAASGVKDCPRCGIGMQKTMGCNHMTCHCGAHVCWTCMREFPRETIYQHMRDACGGSGIAGDPGPNENPPPNAGGALLDAEERRAQAELLLFWQNRQILLAGRAVHDAATLERAARWITEREARRGRGGNGGGNLVDVQVPGAPGIPGLRNPFVPQGVGRRMVVRGPGGAHFGREDDDPAPCVLM